MDEKEKRKLEENKKGAIFVPAGALLGLGIGLAYNNPGAGVLIGLGVGFAIFATLMVIKK